MLSTIRKKVFNLLNRKYVYYIFLLLIFTMIGYAGENYFIFDIASHFRVQLLAISVIFVILYIPFNKFKKQSKWILITLLISLTVNAFEVMPWLNLSFHEENRHQNEIKVALSNVLTKNNNYQALINFINTTNPDIIVLQEVNDDWMDSLSSLNKSYPYLAKKTRDDNFGIALYSKIPLKNIKIEPFSEYKIPMIFCEIQINDKKVEIASLHAIPPINQINFELRNAQISYIADWAKHNNNPKIIVGDLNTTMFSPSYKRLIKKSGIKNSRKGFGVFPTWSTTLPFMLRVPLDMILHTDEIQTLDVQTGENIGSDHLPIIVDLSL